MLAGFLLGLREGIEAALIIGIVLGMLRKMNRMDRAPLVWLGVGIASALSIGIAIALNVIGARFEGAAEELFEGVMMLLAAGVLTWMIFWMQKQGRETQRSLEADVKNALAPGAKWALFLVSFLAVLREGIELALFLTAVNFAEPGRAGAEAPILGWLGGLLGLLGAIIIGWLTFESSLRLNMRRFFQFTSVILVFFAAGLVGHAIGEFNELGWIPRLVSPLYDVNSFISEASVLGKFLKALFGYIASPSLSQTIGYVGYFAVVLTLMRVLASKPAVKAVKAA
jgi:high-affinity iron transporter